MGSPDPFRTGDETVKNSICYAFSECLWWLDEHLSMCFLAKYFVVLCTLNTVWQAILGISNSRKKNAKDLGTGICGILYRQLKLVSKSLQCSVHNNGLLQNQCDTLFRARTREEAVWTCWLDHVRWTGRGRFALPTISIKPQGIVYITRII